jgi:hypothetical protein
MYDAQTIPSSGRQYANWVGLAGFEMSRKRVPSPYQGVGHRASVHVEVVGGEGRQGVVGAADRP